MRKMLNARFMQNLLEQQKHSLSAVLLISGYVFVDYRPVIIS